MIRRITAGIIAIAFLGTPIDSLAYQRAPEEYALLSNRTRNQKTTTLKERAELRRLRRLEQSTSRENIDRRNTVSRRIERIYTRRLKTVEDRRLARMRRRGIESTDTPIRTYTRIRKMTREEWENYKPDTETTTTEVLAQQVINLTNAERAKEGLPALRYNALLTQSAMAHARDMHDRDYFSHDSPEGESITDRIRKTGYLDVPEDCNCGWNYAVAENIAKGQENAQWAMEDWMNSSGHRANILSDQYEEIGVGIVGTYWVQNFGRMTINQ